MYVLLQAALAGLMGEMIYAPYDITGAKFLWWTWHDTGFFDITVLCIRLETRNQFFSMAWQMFNALQHP